MSIIFAAVNAGQNVSMKTLFTETTGFTINGDERSYLVIKVLLIADQEATFMAKNSNDELFVLKITFYSECESKRYCSLKNLDERKNSLPYLDFFVIGTEIGRVIIVVSKFYEETIELDIENNNAAIPLYNPRKREHPNDDVECKRVKLSPPSNPL
ncbi:hypothetical protein COBT_000842 [Conglomerata obtusa]